MWIYGYVEADPERSPVHLLALILLHQIVVIKMEKKGLPRMEKIDPLPDLIQDPDLHPDPHLLLMGDEVMVMKVLVNFED